MALLPLCLVDKKEIQVWYQAFLRDCPTGLLSKERFLQMYDNFFPFGDSTAFAGHMFRVYTTHFNGLDSSSGPGETTKPSSSSMVEVSLPAEGSGESQPARSHKRGEAKASSDKMRMGEARGSSPAPSSGRNSITFEEYLQTLSIIARGRAEEKLRLAFTLYDHDGDGLISHADMTIVVDAIYRMVGALVEFASDEEVPRQRVDKVFALFNKVG